MPEYHDIFVRAHTVTPPKKPARLADVPKWAGRVLVFDTETTIDASQNLTFGCYRIYQLGKAGYKSSEEGFFYRDGLDPERQDFLKRYVDDPKNVPATEVKKFPPQMRLKLYSLSDFVERVFWKIIREGGMIVGFNLPFDLSRLAAKACPADDGGWSLVLSMRKSRKTGEMEHNPERPRIVIASKDSKTAFISLRCIRHPEEWPDESRFLDLRTLGWASRNKSFTLDSACEKYRVPGKMKHKPTGKVTVEEINYCREDVAATARLLNAMKTEFDQHPFELRPDRAYSPASIAKAYLDDMGIALPKAKFDTSGKELGIAMQAYFGGRAECRIRKTPVPIVLTDFTSQYPTVNALLGNWDVLKAEGVSFDDCTAEVRDMLRDLKLEQTFNPAFWKGLSFFALVLPENDILPVRTVYNSRTQNIGLNYLTSEKPLWFAGPDVVVSALLGKSPQIVKAIRMVPHGKQPGLKGTNVAGMVAVSQEDDFFVHVVEQKAVHKPTNKDLAYFLKILANSGSYGLFVEVIQEKANKPVIVHVFSGERSFENPYSTVENTRGWYFPPLASLITAGGRLLLAMLEKCVTDAQGSYLFCDTDSLCIVSSEHGGLVPCPGGPHKMEDGREAAKTLPWEECQAVAARFNALNPYNRLLVPEILKIEDINFVDSNPHKPQRQRQLYGYAISAQRYVLYSQTDSDISIVKASGHGLGYLCPPNSLLKNSPFELLFEHGGRLYSVCISKPR